jgi:hypothetical protein
MPLLGMVALLCGACAQDMRLGVAGGGGSGGSGAAGSSSTASGACVTRGGTIECNPVTNEGYAANDACDATSSGGFTCFTEAEGSTGAMCEPCDIDAGTFCRGTLTCDGERCVRYCCTDGDCGSTSCVKAIWWRSALRRRARTGRLPRNAVARPPIMGAAPERGRRAARGERALVATELRPVHVPDQ